MSSPRIATRYAKALLKLSGSNSAKAKENLTTIKVVGELFAQKDSGRVMRSPVMPVDLKISLIDYALKQAGGSAANDLKPFLTGVLEAGRIAMLPDVIAAYTQLIDEAEGKAEAELISAVELPSEDIKAIEATLSKVLNKAVTVKTKIDKSVLGGFVVRVGNYLVDLSLKTKLDGLAKSAVQSAV